MALEIWMLSCILQVFAALCEYAIILWLKQKSNQKATSATQPTCTDKKHFPALENLQKNQMQMQGFIKVIDQWALVTFPLIFCIYNAIYWPVYSA